MDEIKLFNCSRRISKYQNELIGAENWWNKLFKVMDEEVRIPCDHRLEVLHKIFPDEILTKIRYIISVEELKPSFKLERLSAGKIPISDSKNQDGTNVSTGSKTLTSEVGQINALYIPFPTFVEKKELGKVNPYLRFFLRPNARAAIWRPIIQLPIDEMKLEDKARQVTEIIAKDFVKWLRKLEKEGNSQVSQEEGDLSGLSATKMFEDVFGLSRGISTGNELEQQRRDTRRITRLGTRTSQKLKKSEEKLRGAKQENQDALNVSDIMNMFEIELCHHAAKSLSVSVKEIAAVTKPIADCRKLPEFGSRERLQKLLRKDMDDSHKPVRLVAFGKTLPNKLRCKPQNDRYTRTWYEAAYRNENLETMASVWEGITHLRSSKAYCKWLIDHPHVTPPRYLEKIGMLDPEVLAKHHGLESQISIGSVQTPFEDISTRFVMDKIKDEPQEEQDSASNEDESLSLNMAMY